MEQVYQADGAPEPVTSLGRWTWRADTETLELRGAGPARVFDRPDMRSLVMQTPSPLEHRLTRDSKRPSFGATIMLTGTINTGTQTDAFSECITGMQVPVSRGGDYSSFARQYRRAAAPGSPVFVEFLGEIRWRDDETPDAIVIRRFVTIRADGQCRTPP